MDKTITADIKEGMRDSLPVAAGYFGVSFSFGIMAAGYGIDALTATVISLTNLTSAGQFAGLTMIAEGAGYVELFLAQLVINLRYALMSLSLSQKLDKNFSVPKRAISAFWITDENFAISSARSVPVTFPYMLGIGMLPIAGWTLGTLVGALAGEILPPTAVSALSVALYAMFVAIVLPPARERRSVAIVACLALIFSCILYYAPIFAGIGSGFSVIICTVLAAGIGAALFPSDGGEAA